MDSLCSNVGQRSYVQKPTVAYRGDVPLRSSSPRYFQVFEIEFTSSTFYYLFIYLFIFKWIGVWVRNDTYLLIEV